MPPRSSKRVLIVEDDPIIAMVIEDTCRRMGLVPLINLTLCNALMELELGEFNAALVDMGLRGESAHSVILVLIERAIPFFVISGRDQSALIAEFPQVRVAMKPLSVELLENMLRELLDRAPVPLDP